MRLHRLFLVAFVPSVWFNDIFVTILECVLEDGRPIEVCETPVVVPAERIGWTPVGEDAVERYDAP